MSNLYVHGIDGAASLALDVEPRVSTLEVPGLKPPDSRRVSWSTQGPQYSPAITQEKSHSREQDQDEEPFRGKLEEGIFSSVR